jgi:hypothetical protein
LGRPAGFHGFPVTLGDLLVIRTFEIWTHEEDIRRTTGQPLRAPEADRLKLMTQLAIALLPPMLGAVGRTRAGKTAHVVLTGAGGGSWLVPMDAMSPGEPDVRVVADAAEFCRVAAARCTPTGLGADLDGDLDLADDLLAAVSALAVD